MANELDFAEIMDHLDLACTVVDWIPEDPNRIGWIYVNRARCELTGFSREEILVHRPFHQITPETRALVARINEMIEERGFYKGESTLAHKDGHSIPVSLHMRVVEHRDRRLLLTEHHDIRQYKETEKRLRRAEANTRDMLEVIDARKRQVERNIRDNLGIVVFPLLDRLRLDCDGNHRETMDLIAERIRHVTRDMGIQVRDHRFQTKLTPRQQLICELIRDGMTSKDIARLLGCSPSTVNNHRDVIRRRLGLSGTSTNLRSFLESN